MQLCFLFYRNCPLKRLFLLEFNRCLALVTKLSNCLNSPKTSKDASQIFAKIASFIGSVPIKLGVCNDKKQEENTWEEQNLPLIQLEWKVSNKNDLILSFVIVAGWYWETSTCALYWSVMSINGREGQGGSRPRLLTGVRMGLIKQRLNWNK